jgi:carbamoyltransferase
MLGLSPFALHPLTGWGNDAQFKRLTRNGVHYILVNTMIVLGFSGIRNGDYYLQRYGLRFVGHDAAVSIVIDGRVAFAAEEERFTREKHTSHLPINALNAGLRHTGLSLSDIDRVAYTWRVTPLKYLNMCLYHAPHVPVAYAPALATTGLRVVRDLMWPNHVARAFGAAINGHLPPCEGVEHHLGHAATAYFTSPFDNAAVLTIDGQGEDESASLGEWSGTHFRRIGKIRSPNSVGILYGMVTDFLGMRAGWDEYKVMAMAAEGDASRFRAAFARLVQLAPAGRYKTWRTAMVFLPGYCTRFLEKELGIPARTKDEPITAVHFDLAAAMQEVTEQVVFHLLKHLRSQSHSDSLCLAGGVALNSVVNGKILECGLFKHVFVPPVPGDHGGALGTALLVHSRATNSPRSDIGFTPFLGPEPLEYEIESALDEHRQQIRWIRPPNLVERIADLLAAERLIACCYGRMEYGPRALGHRSLLASPINRAMRDTINLKVKHREPFRPFAAIVSNERANDLFDLKGESPFMQFVVPVRDAWRERLEAVHHHGRTRVQTVTRASDPFIHELIAAFERRTGVPALLNTSFNDADEPIVCTAKDALRAFLSSKLDALVIGGTLVERVPKNEN